MLFFMMNYWMTSVWESNRMTLCPLSLLLFNNILDVLDGKMVRQTRTQIKAINNKKKEIKLLLFENW